MEYWFDVPAGKLVEAIIREVSRRVSVYKTAAMVSEFAMMRSDPESCSVVRRRLWDRFKSEIIAAMASGKERPAMIGVDRALTPFKWQHAAVIEWWHEVVDSAEDEWNRSGQKR